MSGFYVHFLFCLKCRSQTSPDIASFKHLLHFHVCFTCLSPCVKEAVDYSTLLPPPLLFWHACARYLFKFLTPRGDRYVPLFPLSPSLVFTACLCLSYVRQYTFGSGQRGLPTTNMRRAAYTFYWLVTTKSFPSCSVS